MTAIVDGAHFEPIEIPAGQSFLWRKDNYPWRRCEWNYHPEFELHLIRHSSGLAYIGDHIGGFEAGQLVLVGSNLPHNWITPLVNNEKIVDRDIVVQFDPRRVLDAANVFPEFEEFRGLFDDAIFGIEFHGTTARKGAALLEEMGHCDAMEAFAILLRFLALASATREYRKLASVHFIANARPATSRELAILDTAIDYIKNNFTNDISISDVAGLVEMPVSSFSRLFKTYTGNTYSDHLCSLRIWSAKQLLSERSMAITDICFEAGFNNISNFNRTFLRETGMTPSKYRRAARARTDRRQHHGYHTQNSHEH